MSHDKVAPHGWKTPGVLLLGMLLGCILTRGLQAQQGIQRSQLLRSDVSVATQSMEVVLGTAEIPAGSNAGRHRHPGMEIGYVLSGEAVMEVAGEAPRRLQAGDAYVIAADQVHDARVTGDAAAKVLAFYLVEKGQPLAVSVPW
ncbi:MAG: cupin domain-containing protein [Paludibacter sp.]